MSSGIERDRRTCNGHGEIRARSVGGAECDGRDAVLSWE